MPIYRLKHLQSEIGKQKKNPDAYKRQIWLVEGEKCADGIANIKNVPGGKPAPISVFFGWRLKPRPKQA